MLRIQQCLATFDVSAEPVLLLWTELLLFGQRCVLRCYLVHHVKFCEARGSNVVAQTTTQPDVRLKRSLSMWWLQCAYLARVVWSRVDAAFSACA